MTEHSDTSDLGSDIPARLMKADLLLLLPFVWQLGFASWANGIEWRPLGLPFGMVWQMAGIVFATAVLALRFAIDRGKLEKAA